MVIGRRRGRIALRGDTPHFRHGHAMCTGHRGNGFAGFCEQVEGSLRVSAAEVGAARGVGE